MGTLAVKTLEPIASAVWFDSVMMHTRLLDGREIRIKFWDQIEKLIKNPSYSSLTNEKLEGTNQWAFTITMNYRPTYFRSESTHSTLRSEARGMLRVDTALR